MSTVKHTAERETSDMPKTFAKRTFTLPLLLRPFGTLLLYMPVKAVRRLS